MLIQIPKSPYIVRLAIRQINGEELNLKYYGIKQDPIDIPLIKEGVSIKYNNNKYNIYQEECIPRTKHNLVKGVINTLCSAADLIQSQDKRVLAMFKVQAFANKHEGLVNLKITVVNAFYLLT